METAIKRALISVHDKTGLAEFARGLRDRGCEILSSGGTYRFLSGNGIDAIEIAAYTESPEVMGGRVKTLHPKIHGGILCRRDLEGDVVGLQLIGAAPIDLVVVNLYPFEKVSERGPENVSDVIENIDIGGPALIRSAAKNFAHVAVVVDPADYATVIANLSAMPLETRLRLARKAFERVEAYDRAIAEYFSRLEARGGHCFYRSSGDAFPERITLQLGLAGSLRYGENPHQPAALYSDGTQTPWRQIQGKEISYNNWLDADSAWRLACEFARAVCAIVKHNNPCGVAEAASHTEAWRLALECDPVSAFGGIVAVNGTVGEELAAQMAEIFLEVVVAPSFDPAALRLFEKKKALRLLEVPPSYGPRPFEIRAVGVGYLVQRPDSTLLENTSVATTRAPGEAEMNDLLFAWKVAKHVKSNAIVMAKDCQAIGVGAGQMSRVDSVRLAAARARKPLQGAALASDAFFPFPDGVEEAAKCGVTSVIQPGGSVRDNEVIDAANRLGLAMVMTRTRHFRH